MDTKSIDERLKQHPQLRARFNAILDIAEGHDENRDTANEVEERTIEELRKLGQEVLEDWGSNKSEKTVAKHKETNPKSKLLKKK